MKIEQLKKFEAFKIVIESEEEIRNIIHQLEYGLQAGYLNQETICFIDKIYDNTNVKCVNKEKWQQLKDGKSWQRKSFFKRYETCRTCGGGYADIDE